MKLTEDERCALLQAAATIYAAGQHEVNRPGVPPYMSNWHTIATAVTEAEDLFEEIVRREQ